MLLAIALANNVFPVPGGPYKRTPFQEENTKISSVKNRLYTGSIFQNTQEKQLSSILLTFPIHIKSKQGRKEP